MKCTVCGHDIDLRQNPKFCEFCGAPVEQMRRQPPNGNRPVMKCRKCGAIVQPGDVFCTGCGSPIGNNQDTPPKSGKGGKTGIIIAVVVVAVIIAAAVIVGVVFAMQRGASVRNEKDKIVSESETDETYPTTEDTQPEETQPATEETQPMTEETQPVTEETQRVTEVAQTESEAAIPQISSGHIRSVEASSYLSESNLNLVHSPDRMLDGSLTTGWVEGASGQGIGEYVTFYFDDTYMVSGIEIYAGYHKRNDLYYKNSRPKDVYIEFADGSGESFTLDDVMSAQYIEFSNPVATESIRLRIDSVYKGNAFEDTVITELSFY